MAGEPDLAIGDANEWVAYLQQLLEHNGLSVPPDGTFDTTTRELVEQFQQSRGLEVTGVVDAQTWAHLTGEAGPQPY
jgi:peptidoglycan hydrolase-like protein with peptidoglycan-binding domain